MEVTDAGRVLGIVTHPARGVETDTLGVVTDHRAETGRRVEGGHTWAAAGAAHHTGVAPLALVYAARAAGGVMMVSYSTGVNRPRRRCRRRRWSFVIPADIECDVADSSRREIDITGASIIMILVLAPGRPAGQGSNRASRRPDIQ